MAGRLGMRWRRRRAVRRGRRMRGRGLGKCRLGERRRSKGLFLAGRTGKVISASLRGKKQWRGEEEEEVAEEENRWR